MTDFKGKVAIVTGAASGIGRATALLLARRGAHVIVNDLFADSASKVEAEITEFGGTAESVAGDVTETGFIDNLFDGVAAGHGHLDIVHNNVGFGGRSTIVDLTDEEWDKGIALNLTTTFRGTRAALWIMREQGLTGLAAAKSMRMLPMASRVNRPVIDRAMSRAASRDGLSERPGPRNCRRRRSVMTWVSTVPNTARCRSHHRIPRALTGHCISARAHRRPERCQNPGVRPIRGQLRQSTRSRTTASARSRPRRVSTARPAL
ncbi:SDR family NAD(P)-dependent oxidoreductase [Streptomyces sp. NPDC004647]|uniref:SDR family NAD(P)-dependent oxidoreductase n=1 Tax=Streptomyces sp. NPDC004647 TaxID=3154671 RepID=UPI0033AE4094